MPIKLNRIYALQNPEYDNPLNGYKFKDEAFKKSPPFKVVPIKETINFKALTSSDFKEYDNYVKKTMQKEHSKEKFLKLFSEMSDVENLKISLIYSSEVNKFLISDGLHRICVCLYKGLIEEEIDEKNFELYFDRSSINFVEKEIKKTCGGYEGSKWFNRTSNGYHSFNIGNINLKGQRTPKIRIEQLRKYYDFRNKTVLDLGCNNGGMLFHLPEIRRGVGVELDKRCINCANQLKRLFQFTYELEFLEKDLNNPLDIKERFDVAFLFSLGSWIKNWRGLYSHTLRLAETVFLETNNDEEGIEQIIYMKELGFKVSIIIENSKDDNTGNFKRKTYLLKRL